MTVPESLQPALQEYLSNRPDWNEERVFESALSLFLHQNMPHDREVARVYLDSLFAPNFRQPLNH